MNNIDKKKIARLIHRLGLKYKLSDHIIKEIVESPYLFTSTIIKRLDLDKVKTEEDLSKHKTNFIYKAFGKLYINFLLINKKNKQKENIIKLNKNKWKK